MEREEIMPKFEFPLEHEFIEFFGVLSTATKDHAAFLRFERDGPDGGKLIFSVDVLQRSIQVELMLSDGGTVISSYEGVCKIVIDKSTSSE